MPPASPAAPSGHAPYPPASYPPAPYPPYTGYAPPTQPTYRAPAIAATRPARRRRGLAWVIIGLFLTPVVALATLLAAAAIAQPQALARQFGIFSTHLTGTVYGENQAQREAGYDIISPLAGATISCGGDSALTNASGQYSLSVLRGHDATCSVSAANYSTVTATIHPQLAGSYTLDFGAPSGTGGPSGPSCAAISSGARCAALALVPGSITGVVLDSATQRPDNSAHVTCWDDSAAARVSVANPARFTTVASASGQYLIQGAPVGPYRCVSGDSETPQPVVARPNAVATLDLSACERHCRGVTFHNGEVLHALTLYLIYWTPPGTRLAPDVSGSRARVLFEQFAHDISGSAFYGLLSQYWDYNGPVRNTVQLGGTYVDTHPYPHRATQADPLSDSDITNEIIRDVPANNWPVTRGEAVVAVITAYNAQTCAGFGARRSCSFPQANNQGFCAYHSEMTYDASAGEDLPYILVTGSPGCDSLPTFGSAPTPYGAPVTDAEINSLSHEIFETVSDPRMGGWYENGYSGEIGDKCEESFGVPARDGSTVRLANGHGYALQREWSQASGTCSYG